MARFRIPLLAGGSGALVLAGALLPWVSMFAGLERLPGTTGPYGRMLAAGGIALLVVSVIAVRVHREVMRWATGLLGGLLLLPAGLAILGQRSLATMDPMLAATAGPGPWVAAVGAAVAFLALFIRPAPRVAATPDRTTIPAP